HIINPVTETTNSNYEFYPQDNSIDLTNRETECLFYTIRGKTSKAIAHILNISSKTVEFHIENLKTKFQCHSKSQLVYKAIEQGYLDKIPASFINASNVCLIP
ncbi:MAG: helix-turn-helix transcriptional regulator, partial [Gammaproteobacteria bacterium]